MQNADDSFEHPFSTSDSCLQHDSADRATEPTVSGSNASRSRREFLAETTAASVGVALAGSPATAETPSVPRRSPAPSAGEVSTTLHINGKDYALRVEPRVSLLDAIREQAHLTGTKKGCDHGQCGACTVHIDGRRVLSCLTLAVMHAGQNITTIEGLAEGEKLHPLQASFLAHDGFQCGFCTPGQIMSAAAMLQEGHAHSDDEIRESMSGNLCRCGAYPNIVAAIRSVKEGKTDASL
jgi:xanthine dehydrogenase YagT iron-sulfur-binding subunit